MESRRLSGNNHWYHETLATGRADTPPLVPEAAVAADPFLLGAADKASPQLQQLIDTQRPMLQTARELYQQLFPAQVTTNRLNTLTLYDRLSSALTVAQVTGIQRLCNHYAARLNPLPGPDSSRESNRRLTQITEYARLMSSQPSRLDAMALQRLEEAGLTLPDIITFHQLIGYVCYQARIVAGIHALSGQPVRWLPGQNISPDAPSVAVKEGDIWQPRLHYPQTSYLSDRQSDLVTQCARQHFPTGALNLLVQDEKVLLAMSKLQRQTDDISPLAQAVCASINGSGWCLQQYSDPRRREILQAGIDDLPAAAFNAEERAVINLAAWLTRTPDRLSAAHLQPLQQTMSLQQIWQLIQQIAIANWQNRLLQTLGSLSPQ